MAIRPRPYIDTDTHALSQFVTPLRRRQNLFQRGRQNQVGTKAHVIDPHKLDRSINGIDIFRNGASVRAIQSPWRADHSKYATLVSQFDQSLVSLGSWINAARGHTGVRAGKWLFGYVQRVKQGTGMAVASINQHANFFHALDDVSTKSR